jgi:serine/threonine protein kinase
MGTFEIMREIAFGDPLSQLKHPEKFDKSFIEFLKSCFIKDPKLRPNAQQVYETNSSFLSKAKDKNYIKENLLKGIPNVQERIEKGLVFIPNEYEEVKDENFVDWNFDINENESHNNPQENSNNFNENPQSGNVNFNLYNISTNSNNRESKNNNLNQNENKTSININNNIPSKQDVKANGLSSLEKLKSMFDDSEA